MANEYDLEVVVYDESEYFPDWKSKKFNYPFSERKTLISTFKIDTQQYLRFDGTNYEYTKSNLQLQRSLTCLEPDWYG